MNEIGGYFELEMHRGVEFHCNALALNTGRNAFELILSTNKFIKVYIPYYTCDVLLEPLKRQGVVFEYYHINSLFEPVFDFSKIGSNEGFLYTNYFGIKDRYINSIATSISNLIIDNTQSFFSQPIDNVPTFYSCRKFFGVPDGSYLYINELSDLDIITDHSESRFGHLLKRVEYSANVGYSDFKENDNNLCGQPIMKMSKLTKRLLASIDYDFIREKRRENVLFLHKELSARNELILDFSDNVIPLAYPFMTSDLKLKQRLIDNNIFIATYWPNVLELCSNESLEYDLVNKIIPLPIDHRYGKTEMQQIIDLLD